MWQANIINTAYTNGTFAVVVQYTDGNDSDTFQETYYTSDGSDDTFPQAIITNRLTQLSNLDTIDQSITLGTFDPTIPIIPPQTSQQIAAQQTQATWQSNYGLYKQMVLAIAQGFKTNEDKDFTTLQQTLQQTWSEDYLSLLF